MTNPPLPAGDEITLIETLTRRLNVGVQAFQRTDIEQLLAQLTLARQQVADLTFAAICCRQCGGHVDATTNRCAECDERDQYLERTLAELRQQITALQQERDAERHRVDVVIAEFDAPWPHGHTVGDVVVDKLVWKIHECRAALEARAEAAEQLLKDKS